ncbi:4-alpha-glucanotransferase [Amorphus orientalis]|uniref:4-alpha-glucanotransferase n=1 Tax=Amorphus orientalis TaxID=649198 RepID=A0AAE4ATR7_9HYPH|nr:4-alpha-glucanotransferase [Amorphus orientalis]MDQ0316485.1 4-alpha-glucanotransferase [Amorphus orientalis]
MRPIDRLADRYGIARFYVGPDGAQVPVPDDTTHRILAALGVETDSEAAIERALERSAGREQPKLDAQGHRAYLPDWLETGGRCWGIVLQLYELRSARNLGIGDFADLATACRIAARDGADFVGTNPLNALFLAAPDRCSPFSPSNRRFLNPVYIAVDQVEGFDPSMLKAEEVERLRAAPLVDYEGVISLKYRLLKRLFDQWPGTIRDTRSPTQSASSAFHQFVHEGGEALYRHALFETLSIRMVESGHGAGWHEWPEEYRDPAGATVARFAERNAREIDFHAWLQWLAHSQLAEAEAAAHEAGMRIGLYLDFAVGEAPDGSATWSYPELALSDMSIGAPPDIFTAGGQNWGLAPLSPAALEAADFAPWRATMEALMSTAGALRLDHVMALWQLFYVPRDGVPVDGAHVRYPIAGLLEVLADVSNRHRTVVVGEDLGYVPEGFGAVMEVARILSYRILYFEGSDGRFRPAEHYPRLALACLSTHDLPTFAGWWRGDDVPLRLEQALIDETAAAGQADARTREREALVDALTEAGVLTGRDADAARAAARAPTGEIPETLTVAVHRFVARTPSMLAAVRLADLTGEREPTNLPGTLDSYPNWRPKSSVPLEELATHPLYRAVVSAVAEERPKP